jgi:pimeloyl-ACP methyl ester carboxylesterase
MSRGQDHPKVGLGSAGRVHEDLPRRFNRSLLAASVLLSIATTLHFSNAAAQDLPEPGQITLAPCHVDGISGESKCGKYEVYENRITKRGRKLALKVVVIPASGDEKVNDPVFFVAGGPGSAATASIAGVAGALGRVRENRDLVFVDQRGSGGSHPLNCDLYDPASLKTYFGDVFPSSDLRKCREYLSRDADLSLYTTPIAMDDLDEIRSALGYDQINLFGASYGTRAALVYLARHGEHVRTVTLQGVSATDEFVPQNFPQNSQRALEGIINECQKNAPCSKAFPNLNTETKQLFERLALHPVETTLPGTGVAVQISQDQTAEAIRFMLYQPGTASRVPLMLHTAFQGDFGPIAQASLAYRRQILPSVSVGLYLSITCAEDVPWIKQRAAVQLAHNTFLGNSSLRQLKEACALWPRANIPITYSKPTRSTAPVLILTGEWDPVTPPANAAAVAQSLPNSLNLVVPHGGHDFGDLEGIGCVVSLLNDFIEKGRTNTLDTSCLANVRRRGFALPPQVTSQ